MCRYSVRMGGIAKRRLLNSERIAWLFSAAFTFSYEYTEGGHDII